MGKATGTISAIGAGTNTLVPASDNSNMGTNPFNLTLTGPFVGTVVVERSFDDGTTYVPLTALGSAISFTTPCSETFEECENGVRYRVNCTAFTSGTITYRLSQ